MARLLKICYLYARPSSRPFDLPRYDDEVDYDTDDCGGEMALQFATAEGSAIDAASVNNFFRTVVSFLENGHLHPIRTHAQFNPLTPSRTPHLHPTHTPTRTPVLVWPHRSQVSLVPPHVLTVHFGYNTDVARVGGLQQLDLHVGAEAGDGRKRIHQPDA